MVGSPILVAVLSGCSAATILLAPTASADQISPPHPGLTSDPPAQGPLELPDKHGHRHVLRQDQAFGGADPDVPYGTNPFARDEDTVIGGADPQVPYGVDPLVPLGTWQN